jgi:hypothetical protein
MAIKATKAAGSARGLRLLVPSATLHPAKPALAQTTLNATTNAEAIVFEDGAPFAAEPDR